MMMNNMSSIIRHHDRNNTSFVHNSSFLRRDRGFQDDSRIEYGCGRKCVEKCEKNIAEIINAEEDRSMFVIKNEMLNLEDAGCVFKVNIL